MGGMEGNFFGFEGLGFFFCLGVVGKFGFFKVVLFF